MVDMSTVLLSFSIVNGKNGNIPFVVFACVIVKFRSVNISSV